MEHRKIAIVTKSMSLIPVPRVEFTVFLRVKTVHRTIAIVTNSQSALPVALLH